ncbi:hypothetical protein [Streptomyces sp. NPDC048442]|uniref:hypothetical protein n=1 Tax=Streptomyces sp. NPDC048442 TaxID=3154823 RepID=UPI00342488B1
MVIFPSTFTTVTFRPQRRLDHVRHRHHGVLALSALDAHPASLPAAGHRSYRVGASRRLSTSPLVGTTFGQRIQKHPQFNE